MGIASTAAISGLNAAILRLNASASSIAGGYKASEPKDMAEDILDFISARNDFSANLQVMRTENEMYATLLDVLA